MKIRLYLFLSLLVLTFGSLNAQFPTDGLVAYYPLDGNVVDSTAAPVDGQIVGNVTPAPNRFDQEGRAMFFDGDSYVEIETTEKFQIQEAITISLWINPSSVTTDDNWIGLFNKWQDLPSPNTGGLGYYIGLNPDGIRLRWNTGVVQGDGSRIFPNEWTHIAVTYDVDSLRIYRDGQQEFARVAQGQIQRTNTVPVRMGAQSEEFNSTTRYHGYMDEILVYDRALNADEISQIYGGIPTSTRDINPLRLAQVFPNPCTDIVRVSWPDAVSKPKYGILSDLLGRPLQQINFETTTTQISTIDLPRGIYLLSFFSEDQQQTIRLVKE